MTNKKKPNYRSFWSCGKELSSPITYKSCRTSIRAWWQSCASCLLQTSMSMRHATCERAILCVVCVSACLCFANSTSQSLPFPFFSLFPNLFEVELTRRRAATFYSLMTMICQRWESVNIMFFFLRIYSLISTVLSCFRWRTQPNMLETFVNVSLRTGADFLGSFR